MIKSLLSYQYWLSLQPAALSRTILIVLGAGLLVMLVGGIVIRVLAHKLRKNPPLHRVYVRISKILISMSLAGAVLYGAGYEQAYVFSARFWWLLWLLGAIAWAVIVAVDFAKRYPAERQAYLDRLAREKYLPR